MPQCTESGNFGRKLANDAKSGHLIAEDIISRMTALGWSEKEVFAVHLALSEGITNAIEHGNGSDPRRFVQIEATIDRQRVWIRIVDEGSGFQPHLLRDPTDPANIGKPHGRGVLLMRKLMDKVTFHDVGNDVRMEKYRTAGG